MITRIQLNYVSESIIEHLRQHGSMTEVVGTAQGLKQGVKQDLATAEANRGKIGLGAGALGALYLAKKSVGEAAKKSEGG